MLNLFKKKEEKIYKVYCDGATEGHNGKFGTVTHCGIGIYCPDKNFMYSRRIEAKSNNEAEFYALIYAMEWAKKQGIKKIIFHSDSQIVVNRANGKRPKGKYHNERMNKFQDKVLELAMHFDHVVFIWIRRNYNQIADSLSKRELVSK